MKLKIIGKLAAALTVMLMIVFTLYAFRYVEEPYAKPTCSYANIVPNSSWAFFEGITFRLYQDRHPVDTAKLTIIMENSTNNRLTMSWDVFHPIFEKYENGEWQQIPSVDGGIF